MKIAIVHDDFMQFGGAESLVLEMLTIWPNAVLYTSVVSKKWKTYFIKNNIEVKESFMRFLPFKETLNRFYGLLGFHVYAFEAFDFSGYDLVISSSARFAHAVITKPFTKHVCYMNSPGRMLWEPFDYFKHEKINKYFNYLNIKLYDLRQWDYVASQRVDYFIANAKTPQVRIKKYYSRESKIIYPFVDFSKFSINHISEEKYFLVISRLLSWKKIELAILACEKLGLKLKIIGEGPDRARLESFSKSSTTVFYGRVLESEKISLLQNSIALINTQKEDFGIVPLEAMACGKPVIAFGKGGVLETVIPYRTGTFFKYQTVDSLVDTLRDFDKSHYKPENCRSRALEFDKMIFRKNLIQFINTL